MKTVGQDIYETARAKDKLETQLFNDASHFPFFPIPQSIYNEHFKAKINEHKLTYWFLDYYAKKFYERRKEVLKDGGGLNSTITITKELLRIKELEKDAKEWFLDPKRKINLSTTPSTRPERIKIEIIRILDKEYYKNHPVSDIYENGGDVTIKVYADHIYLKPFLITRLKELEATGNKSQTTQNSSFDPKKQLQNEFTPLIKTSSSQHNYKKHPAVFDLIRLPGAVSKKYSICCKYKYIRVSGFGEVPIPLFAISGVERQNIDIKTIPLKDYAKGFIQGYNSDFIPFIDSIDTRREVILHEAIFKGEQGFEECHNEKGIEYKTESMFESGLFEGKRYKAWEFIFETPLAFIQHFESPPSQITKASYNIIPSKEDDIKNVNEILKPFSGYWNREKIMNKKDFDKVKEYLISIINTNSLPNETKQIPVTNVSTEFIRRTIYEVYKYLGKKNRNQFIKLVHVFKQFENTDKNTTDRKFSQYSGNYDNDIATMIAYK